MEKCIVEVESENEVTKVVDICYKNGVEWRLGTKDYIPFDFKKNRECYLFVQNIITYDINAKSYAISKSKRDKQNIYSAKEFIRKFGESKYRIKTKEEFIEEFGKNWRYHVNLTFTPSMDELFGIKLTNDEYIELEQKGSCYIRSWFISKDMITEVKKKPAKQYRIKTEEECIKEFGENWRNMKYEYVYSNDMNKFLGRKDINKFLGRKLTDVEYTEIEQTGFCKIEGYPINRNMITEVKDKPINRWDKARWFETITFDTITKPFRLEKEKFKLSDSLFKRKKPKLNQDN